MSEGTTWRCAAAGCDRGKDRKAAKGLCGHHYNLAHRAASPRRPCSVSGCDRQAPRTQLLCRKHAQAANPTSCQVQGCGDPAYLRGWCERHHRPFKKYGLAPSEFDALLHAQGGGCAICGTTQEDSPHPLVVDHDHACCPGARTCGTCVRGILCRSCNVGIGLLNDDASLVLAAHRYLSST